MINRWMMRRLIRSFARNQQGGIAVLFSAAVPVLLAFATVAIDTARWTWERSTLQVAADAAALAAVREMSLPGADLTQIAAVAQQFAASQLGGLLHGSTIRPVVNRQDGTVQLSISRDSAMMLASLTGGEMWRVAVNAKARMIGSAKICLIALDPTTNKAISISKSAKLTGRDCSIFANSTHQNALSVKDNAILTAASICSSGGTEGGSRNFSPSPRVDCPPVRDPLAVRPPPPVGGCDHSDKVIEKGTVVLRPGVYCGGLKVTKNAVARLDAGIYVMKDGKLIVDDAATLEGVDVGFYLTGGNAQFEFDKGTTISLAAPKTGPMAGLLFFEDRAAAPGAKHAIRSNNAHTLLGTVYLPRGMLHIDADAPIADRAAYTIIVTNEIELIAGPELFLNANYNATTVPVPAGLGPTAGLPQLMN